jgi:ferredoxin-2, mitochondrial
MNDLISISVEDRDGNQKIVDVPTDINLSLMEVLRASEYDIAATCGGMALCATCHIKILKGQNELNEPTSAELDMLDTLPAITSNSRLACQIKIAPALSGLVVKLIG